MSTLKSHKFTKNWEGDGLEMGERGVRVRLLRMNKITASLKVGGVGRRNY